MKKAYSQIIFSLIALFMPTILVSGQIWLNNWFGTVFNLSTYLIVVWVISIILLTLYFIFKPCGFWAVIVGLIVSPLYPFMYETIVHTPAGFLVYMYTVLVTLFYTLPFTLLSIIAFFVVLAIRNVRKKSQERTTKED